MIKKNCFHISRVIFVGNDGHFSETIFKAGLNVITGPTDTGKSFILETVDFMLGGKDPLRKIDELKKYHTIYLEIQEHGEDKTTIKRSVSGGDFHVYLSSYKEDLETTVRPKNYTITSFRKFLNETIGSDLLKLKYNKQNQTKVLSFRNLISYFILEEDDIISKESGIISEQYTEQTYFESMFKYTLTGKDDSNISKTKKKVVEEQVDEAKKSTIIKVIKRVSSRLDQAKRNLNDEYSSIDVNGLLKQQVKERKNIEKKYSTLLGKNVELQKKIDEINLNISKLSRDIKRFEILDKHYESDLERLEFIFESVSLSEQVPPFDCPYCGTTLTEINENCNSHNESFTESIQAEINKISKNKINLKETNSFLKKEYDSESKKKNKTMEELKVVKSELKIEIKPKVLELGLEISKIEKQKMAIAMVKAYQEELDHAIKLHGDYDPDEAEKVKEEKPKKVELIPKKDADVLCDFTEKTLEEWQFKNPVKVDFDFEKTDIFINQSKRSEHGKGSRAIYKFALFYSLMLYCVSKKRAHPSFLVVDTPLNPFKGKKTDNSNEKNEDSEIQLIYEKLSGMSKDYQVILLENKEPDKEFSEGNFIYFTGDSSNGRAGLL